VALSAELWKLRAQDTGYSREDFLSIDPMVLLAEESKPQLIERLSKALGLQSIQDQPALILEYIAGQTLRDHIRQNTFKLRQKLEIAVDLKTASIMCSSIFFRALPLNHTRWCCSSMICSGSMRPRCGCSR
jgi:hypothetical protein